MLQEIQTACKSCNPLVTNMGLDYKSIVRSVAAKILSYETVELSAKEMYDLVEDNIKSKNSSENGKKFWEDVIAEMIIIDEEHANEISKIYLKLVLKNYLPTTP